FLAGFLTLSRQIDGLIGPRGILPADEYLAAVARAVPGASRFFCAPSIVWLGSARTLPLIVWGGAFVSLLVVVNVAPRFMLFASFALYLSFVNVARTFSGFQSDGLLLESALFGLFLAPGGLRPGLAAETPPSPAAVFMLRWLLFRLMLESGL